MNDQGSTVNCPWCNQPTGSRIGHIACHARTRACANRQRKAATRSRNHR
jgi:hypothetical protein